MPHYADGRLAQVGDIVTGTSYNKNGVFVGVIKKITSQGDTCNAIVERKIILISSGDRVENEDGVTERVRTRTVFFDDGEDYTQVNRLTPVEMVAVDSIG